MHGVILSLIVLLMSMEFSQAGVKSAQLFPLAPIQSALRADLKLIETAAELKTGSLNLVSLNNHEKMYVRVACHQNNFLFEVNAPDAEKASTFYKGLKEIGFLFPHPKVQISPTLFQMKKFCGKTINWRPALKYRGSHLHNLHPNEWVHGFYMNKPNEAEALIRWLARNGQNLMDMSILRIPLEDMNLQMKPLFTLAQSLGIHTGVTVGLAFTQQKSYKLISLWQSLTGWGAEESILKGLKDLFQALPLSFIVLEAGTSEFTPTNYEKTLDWLNLAAKYGNDNEVAVFTRVHVSTNQHHKKYGNYNFLPQYAKENVGILAHTVMFYGLLDKKAPIYGNKSFKDIKNFILQEKSKRPTWYYPETSYWVGMDLDIPLLLTDYLYTRAQDYKWSYLNELDGHINFTTGHALGGWLYDWNLALINDLDHNFSPLTALNLLGEDKGLWQLHLKFQHEWFKKRGLIAPLSSANLQDELSEKERIHDRLTMKQLSHDGPALKAELQLLEEAYTHWPPIEDIKNQELKTLLHITNLRHQHAIYLRKAIRERHMKLDYLNKAKAIRTEVHALVAELSKLQTSYPGLPLFEKHKNPTSYQFGYAYPAASNYFWRREEKQILRDSFFPFKDNIYDVWNILF